MRILFVCLGNICRSPMAESIMRAHVHDRGLNRMIEVDSAGTGGWHVGEEADPRTAATLREYGIACTSLARQLTPEDFQEFDLLLAMDSKNLAEMRNWPNAAVEKTRLFLPCDVPDPYYGGPEGFERMYRMIDAGCVALLDEISQHL